MDELDALFAEFNRYPLVAKIPTNGKNVRNELPLVTQANANLAATLVWALAGPRGQSNLQATVERSIKRRFLPYINGLARGNSKSFHHLYEWGRVGQTSARLFDLKVPSSSRGKANFSMRVVFRPSKTFVPLTEAQSRPNPITKAVVKKAHIFYNKAMVMENGLSVIIKPLGKNYMAFDTPPGSRTTLTGLTFTKTPIEVNYSEKPTYHALAAALASFSSGYGSQAAGEDVNLYVARAGARASDSAKMINISIPSDSYAKAVGKKFADSLVVM